ncbi:MAG: hypothetical protein HQ578_02360, partial [Chloroflexi bacterium]|nr:hypothetical protein [Chloroflexota bacterium]
ARPDAEKNDLVVHLDFEDPTQAIAELRNLGFSVDAREFKPCDAAGHVV